jgi:hypothetical protein
MTLHIAQGNLVGFKPTLMEILKCNTPFLKFFIGKRLLFKEIGR